MKNALEDFCLADSHYYLLLVVVVVDEKQNKLPRIVFKHLILKRKRKKEKTKFEPWSSHLRNASNTKINL